MRVVLDTNVVVSGLLIVGSGPAAILDGWRDGQFEVLTSRSTIAELRGVVELPRIVRRLPLASADHQAFLEDYSGFTTSVETDLTITAITADPSDNVFLELAVAGAADYVVSGDRHLLDLGSYQGIPILTPARFLAVLALE